MVSNVPLQTLEGTLERLTYQNEENGYTVARLIPEGKRHEVTVVGNLAGIGVGESLLLRGLWTSHARYGRQFEVQSYQVKLPATVEGIRKYLGSGLIRGVGPVTAERIVDAFGLNTLEVIERDPQRLREIPGVGPKRVAQVAEAWEEQKQIKEIMVFLQGLGLSSSLAVKLYKQYGTEAGAVVQTTPYRLAKEVFGIGFKTADRIARSIGIAPDAPERIQAGLRYALGQFSDNGHCYGDREALINEAASLLEVSPQACQTALADLVDTEEIIKVETPATFSGVAVYLPPFYYAEKGAAARLRQLSKASRDRLDLFRTTDWDTAFAWLHSEHPLQLVPEQQAAIRMALTQHVSVVTGGPGTGKSTLMGSLIQLLQAKGRTVLLCAPTGRAAKRLSETTGLEAKTIHRLLEFKPGEGTTFLRDRENPLNADLIIIDEASMIDILLANHLLKAIEAGTHVLFVGDADQLPSVGPGNVLHDLIHSDAVPVTHLETIFRQSESSYITVNAHRINSGEMPVFSKAATDFYLFGIQDPEAAADMVIDVVAHRIPQKFGLDPQADIQVLSPMHRGDAGVTQLNQRLQHALNPARPACPQIVHGTRHLRQGDRVMQIRNDYQRQVFNGDMGEIVGIDTEEHLVDVDFEGETISYELAQLDELVHAYAVSIHKSQGSEFPAVVVPILTQHYVMLQRNLLYTAVTRARNLVVIVGDRRAIAIAVRNNRVHRRNTRLVELLQKPVEVQDSPQQLGYLT